MHIIIPVKSNKQIKYNCYGRVPGASDSAHVQLFHKWEN